jgi:hypothetical protein
MDKQLTYFNRVQKFIEEFNGWLDEGLQHLVAKCLLCEAISLLVVVGISAMKQLASSHIHED